MSSIADQIHGYLNGDLDYDALRDFIYARYEAEEELDVEADADELLSVLSPYVETEEALPDPQRDVRLRRLWNLTRDLRGQPPAAVTVFALKYDEIADLVRKRNKGAINDDVLRDQMRKLTPARCDLEKVIAWAEERLGDAEPSPGERS